MKYINKILVAVLLVGVVSCDSYLDEPKPTDAVSAADVFATSSGVLYLHCSSFLLSSHQQFGRQSYAVGSKFHHKLASTQLQ